MVDFEADIRLVVRVPFTAAGATEDERAAAATHAEEVLVDRLRKAIGVKGDLISFLVEEVRER